MFYEEILNFQVDRLIGENWKNNVGDIGLIFVHLVWYVIELRHKKKFCFSWVIL